jgi:hypothetical protein
MWPEQPGTRGSPARVARGQVLRSSTGSARAHRWGRTTADPSMNLHKSSSCRGRMAGILATANVALYVAPAHAQPPQLIPQLRAETPIRAYGDHLVWSEHSRSARGFVLVDLVGGVRHVLRARPRAVPFDVDLGPDSQGRATAVYSRCERGPWGVADLNSGQLAYAAIGARDARCDLYRVTLPSGREQKLRRLDTTGDSEVLPAIWDNTIAFVRVETHRRGVAGALPHLLYSRGSGPLHKIRGGTRGRYTFHGYFKDNAVT